MNKKVLTLCAGDEQKSTYALCRRSACWFAC